MIGRRLIILALAGMFFCAGFTGIAFAQEPETVYIGEGDHYASGPYYAWESADLWVNMTVVQGDNVDVYVMSMTQYMNAYPYEQDPGGIAFKNCSQENVSQTYISLHVEIDNEDDMWMQEEIWVIVDNREVSATPDDANPTGTVRIELEIDWVTDETYYDDFFWLESLLCVTVSLIPIILIVVLLFLIYRKIDNKKNNTQLPMPYYQPYPPVQPVQQFSQEPP
ncbi:MAG: hypothetical protein Q7J68_07890, partial [Thermoplasmata archaeon]|nr:hypothetical protein [Thermoplasmata archaeon]